ncbi:hypothetical protein ACOZ4N_01080 (plasmid) [Halorientalis pallida]|uniref:hypothetical protein n=1 Tax=Halorientalis pallida TaxID=2479928 RepID=UPI003C6F2A3F
MADDHITPSRRTVLGTAGITIAGMLSSSTAAARQQDGDGTATPTQANGGGSREEVMEIIDDWEEKQRTETMNTMDKYGVPAGITERRLIWYDAGPWKRIEIFKNATQHNFPTPHPDFFEQFIDYQVPTDKADELTEYDGSVMFERTTGELSARCHTEWANFLAINLAHELLTDQLSVDEARRAYAQAVIAKMNGQTPPRTESFQFDLPQGPQVDRGEAIIQNGEIVMDQGEETETQTQTPTQ